MIAREGKVLAPYDQAVLLLGLQLSTKLSRLAPIIECACLNPIVSLAADIRLLNGDGQLPEQVGVLLLHVLPCGLCAIGRGE